MSGLEELRRLEGEATPGPWVARQDFIDGGVPDNSMTINGSDGRGDYIASVALSYKTQGNDAEFIVAARNQLPRILDALDAAEAAIVATVEHFREGFDLDNREGKQHQANSNRAFGADTALEAFRAAITKALEGKQ